MTCYIVTGRSMRASRCCGRPVLQFHGAGSTIARAQPPPKHMHCRHYRPTTVPNTSQNGRPTHQSGPNSSTLSLQGVVFKVEGTKVTLCHRRQSSPYRNFPELSLSSTSVLNCTWQYYKANIIINRLLLFFFFLRTGRFLKLLLLHSSTIN
jgi:hypothetical protein